MNKNILTKIIINLLLLLFVVTWVLPTFGLYEDQIEENGTFFIKGNLLDKNSGKKIISYGITSKEMNKYKINQKAILKNKSEIEISENGEYIWKSEKPFKHKRGKRIFITALSPPKFTLDNYTINNMFILCICFVLDEILGKRYFVCTYCCLFSRPIANVFNTFVKYL